MFTIVERRVVAVRAALLRAARVPRRRAELCGPGRSRLGAFDENGDRRVSLQEFLAQPHADPDPERIFAARDADADGSLTRDEYCSGWSASGPHMGMPPGSGMGMGPGTARAPGTGMGPGMGMARGGARRCEENFRRFDSGADGKLTEQEFTALPHPHANPHAVFVARDQNHDGSLTPAEFCAPWNAPSSPTPAP